MFTSDARFVGTANNDVVNAILDVGFEKFHKFNKKNSDTRQRNDGVVVPDGLINGLLGVKSEVQISKSCQRMG